MHTPDLTPANRDHETPEATLSELMVDDSKLRLEHDKLVNQLLTMRAELTEIARKKNELLVTLAKVYKAHANGSGRK